MKTKLTFNIEYREGYSLWANNICVGYYPSLESLEEAILNQVELTFKPEDMEGWI